MNNIMKCTMCGSRIIGEKSGEFAICEACGSEYSITSSKNLGEIDDSKTNKLTNLRRQQSDSANANDVRNLSKTSMSILEIVVDDYISIYYFAYAENCLGVNKYLEEFYSNDRSACTDQDMSKILDHINEYSDIRDRVMIEGYLMSLDGVEINEVINNYKFSYASKKNIEENYDDVPRDVFICHRSTDNTVAQEVLDALEKDGNRCWISTRNLRPNDSENYWDNIKKAISSCRLFLVISSEDAMQSKDVKNEINIAKSMKKEHLEYKIDPSVHTNLFNNFFDGKTWVDGYDNGRKGIVNLCARVFKDLELIDKVVKKTDIDDIANLLKNQSAVSTPIISARVNKNNLLKKARIQLEDKDYEGANKTLEKISEIDIECAEMWWLMFLSENTFSVDHEVAKKCEDYSANRLYKKALRFCMDKDQKAKWEELIASSLNNLKVRQSKLIALEAKRKEEEIKAKKMLAERIRDQRIISREKQMKQAEELAAEKAASKLKLIKRIPFIIIVLVLILSGIVTGTVLYNKSLTYEIFSIRTEDDGVYITGLRESGHDDESIVIPAEIKGNPVVGIDDSVFANNSVLKNIKLPDTIVSIGSYAFKNCSGMSFISIPKSVTFMGASVFSGNDTLRVFVASESINESWNSDWINVESGIKVVLNAKVAEKPVLMGEYEYNGAEQVASILANDLYALEGNKQTNAGTYTIKATLNDFNNNCVWSDGSSEPLSIEWTIEKKEVDKPVVNGNLVYNGREQTAIPTSEFYAIKDSTKINAGSYSSIATLNDEVNYKWMDGDSAPLSLSWAIAKKSIDKPVIRDDYVYSGEEYNPVVITDEYSIDGNTGKKADSYTTTVTLKDIVNYKWTDGDSKPLSLVWSITKKSIDKPVVSGNLVYNGADQTLISPKEWYTVAGGTGKKADNYTTTVTLIDIVNYKWTDGDSEPLSLSWTISVKEVDEPEIVNEFGYTGAIQTVLESNEWYEVTGNTGKDVNDYVASVSLKDTVNSKWSISGDMQNYSFTWAIVGIVDGFVFTKSEDGNSYSVSGFNGTASNVEIPSGYNSLPIVSIASGAFSNCTNLTRVVLSESLTYIGSNAFSGCSNLTDVVLPDNVEVIEQSAFSGCSSLISIVMPSRLKDIFTNTFSDCSSLTDIVLPTSLKEINKYAFKNCTSLTDIVFPANLEKIYESAFENCTSLKEIYIPDNVSRIEQYAFYGCSAMTIYCEAEKKPNGWGSRWQCYEYGYPLPVYWNIEGFGSNANYEFICKNDQTIFISKFIGVGKVADIPTDITHNNKTYKVIRIMSYAFDFLNNNLSSVIIPKGVIDIAYNAFADCSNLTIYNASACILTYYENPSYLPVVLFKNKNSGGKDYYEVYDVTNYSSAITVDIPSHIGGIPVASIDAKAFEGCVNMQSIVIPDTLTKIAGNAFIHCTQGNFKIFLKANAMPILGDGKFEVNWNSSNEPVYLFSEEQPTTANPSGIAGYWRYVTDLNGLKVPTIW